MQAGEKREKTLAAARHLRLSADEAWRAVQAMSNGVAYAKTMDKIIGLKNRLLFFANKMEAHEEALARGKTTRV